MVTVVSFIAELCQIAQHQKTIRKSCRDGGLVSIFSRSVSRRGINRGLMSLSLYPPPHHTPHRGSPSSALSADAFSDNATLSKRSSHSGSDYPGQ